MGSGKEMTQSIKKLPMSSRPCSRSMPGRTQCGFMVRINGISDTMVVWYESYPHLISRECGITFYHTLDSVVATKNLVDTVIISNSKISTVNEEKYVSFISL